jgi:hypothetical protein
MGLGRARTRARRRLVIGLAAALSVNAALLALLAPGGREARWPTPADTQIAFRLELTRAPPPSSEVGSAGAEGRRSSSAAQRPPKTLGASAKVQSPAIRTEAAPGAQSGIAPPSSDQGAKTGAGDSGAVDAALRARTVLALRKLGACSRMTAGTGDAQDKTLCTPNFAAAEGVTIDTIPIGKRADYDAAHAKAGYLVPADAANPNFKVSDFKRGGTVWAVHAGCDLVHGKWRCGVH